MDGWSEREGAHMLRAPFWSIIATYETQKDLARIAFNSSSSQTKRKSQNINTHALSV